MSNSNSGLKKKHAIGHEKHDQKIRPAIQAPAAPAPKRMSAAEIKSAHKYALKKKPLTPLPAEDEDDDYDEEDDEDFEPSKIPEYSDQEDGDDDEDEEDEDEDEEDEYEEEEEEEEEEGGDNFSDEADEDDMIVDGDDEDDEEEEEEDEDELKEMEASDDGEEEEEDEGEAHLDLLYKNVPLSKENLGEMDAHDLTQKEKRKYTDDLNNTISKVAYNMYALFRDVMTYFLIANREHIIKSKNAEGLIVDEPFIKMVKSRKVADEFLKDIQTTLDLFLTLIKNKEAHPQYTMICYIVQKSFSAVRMRVIPLCDLIETEPKITKAAAEGFASTLSLDELQFQKTAVEKQGFFVSINYLKDNEQKLLNVTLTRNEMAVVSSFLFLATMFDRVKYEVAKKIKAESETATIDSILEKHVEKDSNQMIPHYASVLTRCVTRLAKLFPEVKNKVPKYLLISNNNNNY